MRTLGLVRAGERLKLLCLGAHSDDIEIGAGAAIIDLIARGVGLDVVWVVLSAAGQRAQEARGSAEAFLAGAASAQVELSTFRDGYFPHQGAALKDHFEALKRHVSPDVILTHWGGDAHQDHREVSALTWSTFRDHLILEYEIPKWDGDLGRPNAYVPVSKAAHARKVELLMAHFGSQRSKDWFDAATFTGLARLRGVECRAPDQLAEAFHVRKVAIAIGQ